MVSTSICRKTAFDVSSHQSKISDHIQHFVPSTFVGKPKIVADWTKRIVKDEYFFIGKV